MEDKDVSGGDVCSVSYSIAWQLSSEFDLVGMSSTDRVIKRVKLVRAISQALFRGREFTDEELRLSLESILKG
jgi:hypothetical protein